jgi:hypothetical protein
MASVTQTKVPRKSFYAVLFEDHGVLTMMDQALTFFSDAGAITTVEPSDCNFLTVLGEVGAADTQRIMDLAVHGGYAAVACSRDEGRQ